METSIKLRPYQLEAVRHVYKEWDGGNRRTLIVAATGTGKTVIYTRIVQDAIKQGLHVLVIAAQKELLVQGAEKIESLTGVMPDLEQDVHHADPAAPVIMGSIQTLFRDSRLHAYDPDSFDVIVVDEAHHAVATTYKKVLNYFNTAKVVGVTATPDRGDKKNLADVFDSIAYEYDLRTAIKDGYLCKIKARTIPLKLDITKVGISQGDFAKEASGNALEPYLGKIASKMAKICRGKRKTIVYLPLVRTAEEFADILNDHGFHACEIDGNSKNRDEILDGFKTGKYDVLCNAQLLTEGIDVPSCDCIVPLRPTKIRSAYAQMVGRGTRLYPGKRNLLILDFLWLTQRHDLMHPASLYSSDETVAAQMTAAMKLKQLDEEVDLDEAEDIAERDVFEERTQKLISSLWKVSGNKGKLFDPVDYIIATKDNKLAGYDPTFRWEYQPATKKQRRYLTSQGIYVDPSMTKGKASQLIGSLIKRADNGMSSVKQIRFLESKGFKNVADWQKKTASNVIDTIADNYWKVPESYGNPSDFVPNKYGFPMPIGT